MSEEVIMIPRKQYEQMVESYDKAMEQLTELQELLRSLKDGNAPE